VARRVLERENKNKKRFIYQVVVWNRTGTMNKRKKQKKNNKRLRNEKIKSWHREEG